MKEVKNVSKINGKSNINHRYISQNKTNYRNINEIWKLCELNKPILLLFIPLWISYSVANVALNMGLGKMMDDITQIDKKYWVYIIIMIALGIYTYILRVIDPYLRNRVVERAILKLRVIVGDKLSKISYSVIENKEKGDLLSRCMLDIDKIQSIIETYISFTVRIYTAGILSLFVALSISIQLTLTFLFMFLVLVMINLISAKVLDKLIHQNKEEMGRSSGIAVNILSQLSSVKTFSLESILAGKYISKLKEVEKIENKIALREGYLTILKGFGEVFPFLAIMLVGGYQVFYDEITTGNFAIIIFITNYISTMLTQTHVIIIETKQFQVSCSRLVEVLDLEEDHIENEGINLSEETCKNSIKVKRINKRYPILQISHLFFSYRNDEEKNDGKVLKDISLEVLEGEHIAIVGYSGSGKSTLAKIITGLYTEFEGSVNVFGRRLTKNTIYEIKENVGVVSQENYLFPISIKDNINCGSRIKKISEIIEAAKAANIHETIMRFPSGYETVVGEEGVGISGGERQRICIARAFLKDAELYIFDEPTASIDYESEEYILKSLKKSMKNKTCITIAHRLSTIEKSDRIYCMDSGKIVEVGTHEELVNKRGKYYSLYKKQMEGNKYE